MEEATPPPQEEVKDNHPKTMPRGLKVIKAGRRKQKVEPLRIEHIIDRDTPVPGEWFAVPDSENLTLTDEHIKHLQELSVSDEAVAIALKYYDLGHQNPHNTINMCIINNVNRMVKFTNMTIEPNYLIKMLKELAVISTTLVKIDKVVDAKASGEDDIHGLSDFELRKLRKLSETK